MLRAPILGSRRLELEVRAPRRDRRGGLGWLAWERHELIIQGEAKAIEDVRKARCRRTLRAVTAAKTVDACYAAGGNWDRDNGLCNDPAR